MNLAGSEKLRVFLVNWLLTSISGMTFGEWLRLLRKQRFAVDPPYWPRAALMTATSLINSGVSWYEQTTYGPKIGCAQIKPPVFILGHWRSGTSFLYQLLTIDQRFAYPNVWQALNPHTFLSSEKFSRVFEVVSPSTRLIDNIRLHREVPFEDEFATCGTLCSPFLIWAFPRSEDSYDRYLTFRGVPEAEIARWKAALVLFYQKLAWKYDRPLLLKSPPHTCRIRLLLETFPDARFVHIHRNPYAVFQSTRPHTRVVTRATCFQKPASADIDTQIIRRYKIMYDAFFEERELIPDGQFHEICYEELERDPIGKLRSLYEQLNLQNFDAVQPLLQRYVSSLASYRKNNYAELPAALRCTIARAWRRSFEEWGYPA